jgi:hypothetical protein
MSASDSTFLSGNPGFRLMDYSGEFDNVTIYRENEIYNFTFNKTKLSGLYNYVVSANDTSGNNAANKTGTFRISSPADIPLVSNLTPAPRNFSYGNIVNLSVKVIDAQGISKVYAHITFGGNTNNVVLTDPNVDNYFTGSFLNTTYIGKYTVLIIANDSQGNINNSVSTYFNVTDSVAPVINNVNVAPNPVVQYSPAYFTANVTDNVGVASVTFQVTKPNGTVKNFTGTRLLRHDTYEDSNVSAYATNYTDPAHKGTWTVATVNSTKVYRQSDTAFAQYFSTLKPANYTDFLYSSMLRSTKAIQAGRSIGIVFRYKDLYNQYIFDNYDNEFRLVKKVNNASTVLKTVSGAITMNQWYNFSVLVQGSDIRCYVDGVLKINFTDSSLKYGSVGFRLQDYTGDFDNLTVYNRQPIYTYKYNQTSLVGTYSYKVFAKDINGISALPKTGTFFVGGAIVGNLTVDYGENPIFKEIPASGITALNTNDAASITMSRLDKSKLSFKDVSYPQPIIGIGKVDIILHYSSQAADPAGMRVEAREASQIGAIWCNKTVNVSTSEQVLRLKCEDTHIFNEKDLNNLFVVITNKQSNKKLYIEYALINYTFAVQPAFSIRINSPKNIVYNTSAVTLNFSTYNGVVSKCEYSLNSKPNITITNSSTAQLSGFEGTNNVVMYCNTTSG